MVPYTGWILNMWSRNESDRMSSEGNEIIMRDNPRMKFLKGEDLEEVDGY